MYIDNLYNAKKAVSPPLRRIFILGGRVEAKRVNFKKTGYITAV